MGQTPMLLRRGFTLIEVLVVMTIIILIVASAVPAFRFITGSRSVESAQNVIAAMVGRARSQALADNDHRGVFFFVDPINDRTTMALVQQASAGELGQYSGWATPQPYSAGQIVDQAAVVVNKPQFQYFAPGNNIQSVVVSLNSIYVDTNKNYLGTTRYAVLPYGCKLVNGPSYPGNRAGIPAGNTYWGPLSISIDMIADTDFQMLPQGVGAQLLNSNPTNMTPNAWDRYLRMGCIMFDKNGRFESIPWSVNFGSTLGNAVHLTSNLDLTTAAGIQPLYSQFGIVLYDRQSFLAKNTSAANSAINNPNPTEADFIFGSGFFDPAIYPAAKFPAIWSDEDSEESWLDNNSLPLLIDRYNGTIIKGE